MVTTKMKMAGSQMASDLMDAQIIKAKHMNDCSKPIDWEGFEAQHSGKNMDLIEQYLAGEIDSVTAIYIAMDRAK